MLHACAVRACCITLLVAVHLHPRVHAHARANCTERQHTCTITRERKGDTMRRLACLSKRIRYARLRAPFLLRRTRTTKQPIFCLFANDALARSRGEGLSRVCSVGVGGCLKPAARV